MTITMFDSVEPAAIPLSAPAVAGYVGGIFPDFSQLAARFPKALHKSIAVTSQEDADILDIENGDATPDHAAMWFARQKKRGLALPGFYANASTMPSVRSALSTAGITTGFVLWVADWDNTPVVPEGFQAKQYIDHGPQGQHYDLSVCSQTFWGAPSPPVKNQLHYEWFDARTRTIFGDKFNERQLVEKYDRLRKHGVLNRYRLAPVRRQLLVCADRVLHVALMHGTDGKPNWRPDHLGWRRQQLIHRVQGQRFA